MPSYINAIQFFVKMIFASSGTAWCNSFCLPDVHLCKLLVSITCFYISTKISPVVVDVRVPPDEHIDKSAPALRRLLVPIVLFVQILCYVPLINY